MPITMANTERATVIGMLNVSSNPTNGARNGINRYVIVHRTPEITTAVVVDRRAPNIAFLSTTLPTRKSLRMNRSGAVRCWRSCGVTLIATPLRVAAKSRA